MNIKEVTESQALDLINNPRQAAPFEPLGLFWFKDSTSNNYVAIDNIVGNAYTEEFKTLEDCLKYLRGEPCTTANGFTYF